MSLRIAVIFSNSLFAEGLASLLKEEGFEVVSLWAHQKDTEERLVTLQPDVVILEGKDAQAEYVITIPKVFALSPGSKVIQLTLEDNTVSVFKNRRLSVNHRGDLLRAIEVD